LAMSEMKSNTCSGEALIESDDSKSRCAVSALLEEELELLDWLWLMTARPLAIRVPS